MIEKDMKNSSLITKVNMDLKTKIYNANHRYKAN